MRLHPLFATMLVLSACGGEEPVEPDDPSGPFVTANGSPAGTYRVEGEDGLVSIVTLNPDGTYDQAAPDGSEPSSGTLEVVDGRTCFKVRVAGAEPLCYTESARAEDGSFTATPEGGPPLRVMPMPATGAANTGVDS